ncbi:ABC transporter permease [Balneolaceae bacterium ANBcel3]|nr:ABC transporter permease [Balneolaceae bacterium ANBcel3]
MIKKIFVVIEREYLVRLRSKVFIISTLLAPVLMVLILVLPSVINALSGDKAQYFVVHDETGLIDTLLMSQDSVFYQRSETGLDELRSQLNLREIQGYIHIPASVLDSNVSVTFFHDGSAGITAGSRIRSDIRQSIRDIKLDQLETPREVREVLEERISVDNVIVSETGEEAADSGLSAILGFIMGFIIYGAMLGYGTLILKSVLEEKSSRIVEVVVSSVRSFELLLGKLFGIALLGLTQFVIWSVSGAAILFFAAPLIALFSGSAEGSAEMAEAQAISIPVIGIDVWIGFTGFFLLGFLIYSSLFAAVGAAVEQESDGQQLQLPIVMLIIVPLLFLFAVADHPTSTMAVITSMIPFFAPILMPARMAVISVPFWQLALTFLLMLLTFLFLIWVSARIYRVGILMYGKEASFKELWKWIWQD